MCEIIIFKGSEKNLSLEILSLTAIAQDSLLIAKKFITDIVLSNQDYDPLTENIIFEKIFSFTSIVNHLFF